MSLTSLTTVFTAAALCSTSFCTPDASVFDSFFSFSFPIITCPHASPTSCGPTAFCILLSTINFIMFRIPVSIDVAATSTSRFITGLSDCTAQHHAENWSTFFHTNFAKPMLSSGLGTSFPNIIANFEESWLTISARGRSEALGSSPGFGRYRSGFFRDSSFLSRLARSVLYSARASFCVAILFFSRGATTTTKAIRFDGDYDFV
mmetsp:Transcript_66255/g.138090  ORF Transcript_66255/g.138090 Transcript_66255/m.138090 type:complete len:205 (-) Transcript_66255:106-720(-)